jgi:DNA-binding CsgD family transcriptional regulator
MFVYALFRLPSDIYDHFYGISAAAPYYVFVAAVYAALMAVSATRPTMRRVFSETPGASRGMGKDIGAVIPMALISAALFYALCGVYDALLNDSPIMNDHLIFIRAIQIFPPLLAAFVCVRFGRYAAFFLSVCTMGIAVLTFFFSYSGTVALVCALSGQFGTLLFSASLRILFSDLSFFSKWPGLVGSMGFAAYYLFEQMGEPIAEVLRRTHRETSLALYVGVFLLTLPAVILLFHILQSSRGGDVEAAQTPSFDIGSFDFTKREAELFLLLIQGHPPVDIAENLFLSESTVKTHLHHIIKKANVKNRAELLEKYGDKSAAGGIGGRK